MNICKAPMCYGEDDPEIKGCNDCHHNYELVCPKCNNRYLNVIAQSLLDKETNYLCTYCGHCFGIPKG